MRALLFFKSKQCDLSTEKRDGVDKMLERIFASILFLLLLPLILLIIIVVGIVDKHFPIYISQRVGKEGRLFYFIKIKTMRDVKNAKKFLTVSTDPRITRCGRFLRRFKLDEILPLIQIILGNMHFIGPRPYVFSGEVSLYEKEDLDILSLKPGFVDLSSLIFSKQERILGRSRDPEKLYYQSIFPLKKKLMLAYVYHRNFLLDVKLFSLAVCVFFSRNYVKKKCQLLLKEWDVYKEIQKQPFLERL
jgi:lipopolysaccharide/colanic/teichoic acid biosynthesis glycosyltransferase